MQNGNWMNKFVAQNLVAPVQRLRACGADA